ncbi:MAG: tetratricopeptide repeat protein [Bacillaceae bacterium]|nr:tetratricopeptide repeat protein [Bacillaceae bacterium]
MEKKLKDQIHKATESIQIGQIEKGLQLLRDVRERAGKFPEVLLLLASVYSELGHIDEAEDVLDAVSPESKETEFEKRLLQAEIKMDQEKSDEALDILFDLKEQEPENLQVLVLLADCFALQGLTEVACKYLEQALEIDPDQPEIRSVLGEFYRQLGEDDRAVEHWDLILDEDEQEDVLFKKAQLLAQSGNFEQALMLFRKIIKKTESADALFSHGFTAFQTGEWDEAIRSLKKLVAIDPDYVTAYPVLGECYVMNGEKGKAIECYRKAFDRDETDEKNVIRLGELLFEERTWQEAEFVLKKAVEIDRENPIPYYYLGKISLNRGDLEQAADLLQSSVDYGGDFPDLIEQLSDIYIDQEEYEKAIQLLKRAAIDQPENWKIINRLADLFMEEGNVTEALAWYEKSLSIHPEQYEIFDLIERYRADH